MLRQLRGFAGAVLDDLARVTNLHAESGAVAEMALDDLRAPAGDDAEFMEAGGDQTAENVFQDRSALNLEHRLGNCVGEFLHARAFAGG